MPAILLFMHIPKTAGTTFRFIVEQQYRPRELAALYPGHREQFDAFQAAARKRPPLAAMGHFRFGLHRRLAPVTRYVTFLRDPVDQALSHFNHLRDSDHPDHRAVVRPADGLDRFLVHDWARNLQTQYVTGLTADEIDADPDEAFRIATEIFRHHFLGVGVVEQFAASVKALADRLDWRVPRFGRLNRSDERPNHILRAELPPSLVERLKQANACDRRLHAFATDNLRTGGVPHFRTRLDRPHAFSVKAFFRRLRRSRLAPAGFAGPPPVSVVSIVPSAET